MDIKDFLNQPEIKELIANDNLDTVYKNYIRNYGPGVNKISKYLLSREINPLNYLKESIPAYAFYSCKELLSIVISNGINIIGHHAFASCKNLVSIVIPNSVTSINAGAFFNCGQLENIVLPNSLIDIEAYLFEGCSKLTDIHYKGTKKQWGAIKKGQSWRHGSSIKVIRCTDGDILL